MALSGEQTEQVEKALEDWREKRKQPVHLPGHPVPIAGSYAGMVQVGSGSELKELRQWAVQQATQIDSIIARFDAYRTRRPVVEVARELEEYVLKGTAG
jgi:hypothetical protein